MSGSVAAGGRRRLSGAGKRMTRPSASSVCRHGTGRVSAASPPNLQIDFGILELGSILRSFVLFVGIELVLVGLVGRTPRGSLNLNPIAYLVHSLNSSPFFYTRLRHRARVGQNSLLTIKNHRYQTITYRLPIRDDDDERSAEGRNAAILNIG